MWTSVYTKLKFSATERMAHLSVAPVVVVAVLMVFTDAAEAQAASPLLLSPLITPHALRERGKVIGCMWCPYVCGRKKYLNRTLEIDSTFQTFAAGLLVEFID